MTSLDSVAGIEPSDNIETIIMKRTFASGYMFGKKHGYADAVEESYPELKEGQTEVGQAVGDAITQYLNPHGLRSDPSADFGG